MKPYTNKTDRVDTKKVLYSEIKSDVKARKKAKRNEGIRRLNKETMYIIMGDTIELMGTMDEEYVKELVDTATQNENIFWLKDGDGKPTTPYLKVEEFDGERFNEKGK